MYNRSLNIEKKMNKLLRYAPLTLLPPGKSHLIWTIICVALLFSTCKKTDHGNGGPAPGPPTNVTVETISDGAVISYSKPQDGLATAIVAVYVDDTGIIRTFTFDLAEHPGSITINEGFSIKKGSRTVELYAISATGERSESVALEIAPLPPASLLYIENLLESTEFMPTPTGTSFSIKNPDANELSFTVSIRVDDGDWVSFGTFVTDEPDDAAFIDNLSVSEVRLQVAAVDDAEYFLVKDFAIEHMAFSDIRLDKSKWSIEKLPGDIWESSEPTLPVEALWDGEDSDVYFQGSSSPFPQVLTIDLGENQSLNLSKIKVNHFSIASNYVYDMFNPKEFEIWGSNDPAMDGSWGGWKKIRSCQSLKPSGSPLGTVTDEDFAYAKAGEVFGFPSGTENYRYIRFRTLNTWNIMGHPYSYIRLLELTLWGSE